ncbi:MAG TPA: SRPBCC family protein [Alphaproteobacteria bacterium]|nr:SRPBCC family protein [Alphaproteobacteria bacterium]
MTHARPTHSVRITRRIAAPPERVFDAWLDPQSLAAWMCPGATTRAEAMLEARVGGRFRIVMHGEGVAYEHTGQYRVIERPRRLVFTWVSAVAGETRVTVEFHPVDGGTDLTLTHEGFPDADVAKKHDGGWGEILGKLARRLVAA